MLYIRRKDNPLVVKAWGDAGLGGLGEFDTALYEEVLADELPEGWMLEEQEKPLDIRLQNAYKALPIASRIEAAIFVKNAQIMIQLEDIPGAQTYLQEAELDSQIKNMLLDVF